MAVTAESSVQRPPRSVVPLPASVHAAAAKIGRMTRFGASDDELRRARSELVYLKIKREIVDGAGRLLPEHRAALIKMLDE